MEEMIQYAPAPAMDKAMIDTIFAKSFGANCSVRSTHL